MSDASPQQIVFIDANVADLQDLLGGLAPGVTAFVLDPASDGLQQIADILAVNDLTGLSAISIVGHGAAGEVELGSTTLDAANLPSDSAALAQIGAAPAPGGGIQLYACDVASGTVGAQFIAELSQLAGGATVAAATQEIGQITTPAGTVENWTLDASSAPAGSANTPPAPVAPSSAPFTQAAMANFQGDLAAPINNDQPSLGMMQLVVAAGVFPSRDGDALGNPVGIPIGSIETFAGNFVLGGTDDAAGQILPFSANTELFSVIGQTYGSTSQINFGLPNLQDALAVGTSDALGASYGTDELTLTAQNMPSVYNGGGQPFDNDQPSQQVNYLIDVGRSIPEPGSGGASTAVIGEVIPFLGNFAPDAPCQISARAGRRSAPATSTVTAIRTSCTRTTTARR